MRLKWGPGYRREELERAQARWDLQFPPDMVELYLDRRPLLGAGTIDWTTTADERIAEALAWPLEGFWFDVQNDGLWWREWGPRPERLEEQRSILEAVFAEAPRLIPIYGHRYLPSTPEEPGNPVFSVYQADVIHYGADLLDYLERESRGWDSRPWPDAIKPIPFWTSAVDRGEEESSPTVH